MSSAQDQGDGLAGTARGEEGRVCEAAPEKEGGSVPMLSPLVFSLLSHFVIIPAISAVTDCALPLLLRVRFSGFAGRGKKPAWCKKHKPGLKRQRDGNRCPRWC